VIDLRLGRWQDVLTDVGEVDAVITDPPYGQRTHAGQRHTRKSGDRADWCSNRGLGYGHLSPEDVEEVCSFWAPRVRSWFVAMTSHDLVPHYERALLAAGLYVFKPLPCVLRGMNVRLAGDGPSSWSVDIVVARPRSNKGWGTLPGAYVGNPFDPGENSATASRRESVVGAKPKWVMRALIGDYTDPGATVADPYSGGGTTLIAAAEMGCEAIGAEVDPDTFKKAQARIARGIQTMPHPRAGRLAKKATQKGLF
jgi:hypothetical protein